MTDNRIIGKEILRQVSLDRTAKTRVREGRQWAVGSKQWAVGSKQWAVNSGQWAVNSGQLAVDSGQCTVAIPILFL